MKTMMFQKNILWYLTLAVLLNFCSNPVNAAPPRFVYRADTRSPDQIFSEGFKAWGNDYNIVAHVNGATCSLPGSTSAFISTGADYESIRRIAQEHLRQRPTTYVYTIRADDSFYSGPASVDYFQQYNPLSALSISSLQMARNANEWDAVDHILPANIRDAVQLNSDGTVRNFQNEDYVDSDTAGNENPYTAHAADTLQHYGFPTTLEPPSGGRSLAGLFSSCFASCAGANSPSNGKRMDETCQSEPEKIINLNARVVGALSVLRHRQ